MCVELNSLLLSSAESNNMDETRVTSPQFHVMTTLGTIRAM